MYISQYESTIWKKYIPSKSHLSTHANSREKEKEYIICIYVDVRYMCIILENIASRAWKDRHFRSRLRKAYRFYQQILVERKLCWLGISGCVHTTRCVHTHPGSSYVVNTVTVGVDRITDSRYTFKKMLC